MLFSKAFLPADLISVNDIVFKTRIFVESF